MELPDAAAEGMCRHSESNGYETRTGKEKKKKKSNQWSILKDRERNCLPAPSFSTLSIISRFADERCVFALRSAKNRTSTTVCLHSFLEARVPPRDSPQKYGGHRALERFEFFWARSWQILWLLEFFVRYVAPSKDSPRRFSSTRILGSWHACVRIWNIHTNTHSSLNQCWRRFTGYQDDSWKGDRGNLVSCDNRMWYLESVMQNSKRSFVLVFASVWRYSRLYRGNQVEIVVGSMEFFIHWHQSVIKLEILTCSVRIFNDGCWKRSTIEMQKTTNCNIFEIYYIQICIILFIHILHYQLTICINNM